jgi:hypothetical protein
MSIKNTILRVTRRTKKGLTAGEIFDRVQMELAKSLKPQVLYSSVRARVSEMEADGELVCVDIRKDKVSGREAAAYRRKESRQIDTDIDYF